MSDSDYKQKLRDAMGDLLARVAAGEISAEEAEQELDICKALAELIVIATEIGEVPTSPRRKDAVGSEGALTLARSLSAGWCVGH